MKERMKERMKEYLHNLTVEDKIFWGYILLIFAIHVSIFSSMMHIPGPIYGGDLYRERGFVQYIVNGGSPFVDPYFHGDDYAFYPPLGYITGAAIVKLTGVDVEKLLIFFPAFTAVLTSIGLYLLGSLFFHKKVYGLFLVFVNQILRFVDGKHTYAMGFAFLIFALYFFLKNEQEESLKNKVLAGLFVGLSVLSHYQTVIFLAVLLGSFILTKFVQGVRKEEWVLVVKKFYQKYLLMIGISVLLALIFFAPLIIKYQLQTVNETQKYSLHDIEKFGLWWVLQGAVSPFIYFNTLKESVLSILAILGFLFVLMNLSKKEAQTTLIWHAAIILATAHFLITKPLFNTWVVPGHVLTGIVVPQLFLIVFGIKSIALHAERYHEKYKLFVFILIGILLIAPLTYAQIQEYEKSQWVMYAKQMDPGTTAIMNVGTWILQNTNTEDVFLANDESAFALNALTGRPVVFVRRTHASPYADVDKRYADGVVMLYGKDAETQKELLKKYNVRYAYFDQFLLSYPMIVNKKYKEYLEDNGVFFKMEKVRLDPSTERAPAYDSLVVPPQPLTLVNMTSPVMTFGFDAKNIFSVIHKIQ